MKVKEILQQNHFSEWIRMRSEVENEQSNKQSMFCICGKLATGLHESRCKKFQNEVDRKTETRLKHLIQ